MNKLFFLFLGCFLVVTGLRAQDSTYSSHVINGKSKAKRDRISNMLKMEEEGSLIFNKQNIFGIKLATDGYGVFFEKGKFITTRKTRLIQFELNEKKSPKEKTVSSGDIFGPSLIPYKLNNFYQFKVSYGQQYLIGGKGNKNGVAVTALYTGGVSLGLQKPYYYNITYVDVNGYDSATGQETFPQVLADTSNPVLNGAAGFTKGWGQVQLKPGLAAKAALRFDYGRYNSSITAIEAGINIEYYFSKIEQVYAVPQKQLFFNGYVTIMFGKRK